MEGQLYIRMRGTVLGPYEIDRLQALVRRGQLSRLHEVSPDGLAWSPAGNYPDLFVIASRPAAQESVPVIPASATASAGGVVAISVPAPAQTAEQKWYYDHGGTQVGPIDLSSLQRMLMAGQVSAEDMVWADGMPAWIPAQQVPVLFSACMGRATSSPNAKSQPGDELAASLCRSASDSRPWVLFLGIVSFIYAALSVGFGLLMLVWGANVRHPDIVLGGILNLVYAGMATAAGLYLTNYAGRLASLKYSRNSIVLEKAHDVLRGFWIFVSVSLIVSLTLLAVAVIAIIAAVGSLPFPRF